MPPLTIASPYPDNTAAFDNHTEDHFADVEVLLSQTDGEPPRPLLLHRALLSRASSAFTALFRGEVVGTVCYNAATRRVEGLESSVPGDVMVCWLRFCYGAPMHVEVRTAVAALAALLWLRLKCSECQLQQVLEDFIVRAAGHSIQTGATLLQQCVACPACISSSSSKDRVDHAVARCVLTRENLEAHRDIIVDCLVQLPAECLDMAEYGEDHTECSKFSVMVAYLKHNSSRLTPDEQRRVLARVAWSELSARELGLLRGSVDPGVLFVVQQVRLRELEKKRAREQLRAHREEREREDQVMCLVSAEQRRNTVEPQCESCTLPPLADSSVAVRLTSVAVFTSPFSR